jgi:hypothetical protein
MKTIRELAIEFLKKFSFTDRETIKNMVNHGIICGYDYAQQNRVSPKLFSEELKLIFAGD